METTKIVSDIFDTEELYELLKKEIKNDTVKYLEIQEKPQGTLPIEPTVLIALISAGGLTLNAIITGIFNVWQKKIESKNINSTIKLKGKDGIEIEVPANIKKDELDELIKKAEKMAPLKYIALKEE